MLFQASFFNWASVYCNAYSWNCFGFICTLTHMLNGTPLIALSSLGLWRVYSKSLVYSPSQIKQEALPKLEKLWHKQSPLVKLLSIMKQEILWILVLLFFSSRGFFFHGLCNEKRLKWAKRQKLEVLEEIQDWELYESDELLGCASKDKSLTL